MNDAEIEAARSRYLQHITIAHSRKTNNSVLLNLQEYHERLHRLLELNNDPAVKKNTADYRIVKTYDFLIQDVDGVQTPKLCKRGTQLLYIPIEELFDILHNAHVLLNHSGRNSLQRYFRERYCNVTKDCIMAYLETCIDCPRRKRHGGRFFSQKPHIEIEFGGVPAPQKLSEDEVEDEREVNDSYSYLYSQNNNDMDESSSNAPMANASVVSTTPLDIFRSVGSNDMKRGSFNQNTNIGNGFTNTLGDLSKGQVDVFDMQKNPDGEFNWLLRYINLATNEVRLRALRQGSALETADVLVDIYCEQGAPVVLQSLNGRDFAEEVIREVSKIWPQCRQLHAEFKSQNSLQQFSDGNENAATSTTAINAYEDDEKLLEKLELLMKRHDTQAWAGMLRYLQWELNITYRNDLGRTPIEGALGRIPSLGLKSSKLLDAIYDKARSEEQILEYLQDAELLRLSAFCQQSGASSSSNLTPKAMGRNTSSNGNFSEPHAKRFRGLNYFEESRHFAQQNEMLNNGQNLYQQLSSINDTQAASPQHLSPDYTALNKHFGLCSEDPEILSSSIIKAELMESQRQTSP